MRDRTEGAFAVNTNSARRHRPYTRLFKREHDKALALGRTGLLVYVALCRLQSDARPEDKEAFRAGASRVASLCGLSTRSVQDVLPRLATEGLITVHGGIQKHYEENKVTLLGNATAAAGNANDARVNCGVSDVKKEKRKRKVVECFLPEELPLPHGEQFAAAWRDFCKHRREVRHALTPTATNRILLELGSVPEAEAVRATNEAIARGWRKPFPRESGNISPAFSQKVRQLVL